MILGKMEGPYVEFCADDDQRNYSSRSLNFRLTDHLFSMRSRFTMTSSYQSYSNARADEPDVGIPHILKRMLRISLRA
jgi:hypothetical protein